MDGARQVTLVPFVALAHVDDRNGVLGQELLRRRGIDFVDLGLRLLEKLAVGRHSFTKYSNLASGASVARARLGSCPRAPEFG